MKVKLGKLTLPEPPETYMLDRLARNAFVELPISLRHALHVYTLPMHHRDPFDRILIAQSQLENLPILTADSLIALYDVDIIW